jgi:hypothetical protein
MKHNSPFESQGRFERFLVLVNTFYLLNIETTHSLSLYSDGTISVPNVSVMKLMVRARCRSTKKCNITGFYGNFSLFAGSYLVGSQIRGDTPKSKSV